MTEGRLPLQARASGERGSKGGMPLEFKGHPRLELLWKRGAGLMSAKDKEQMDWAASEGHLQLSVEDWDIIDPKVKAPVKIDSSVIEVPEGEFRNRLSTVLRQERIERSANDPVMQGIRDVSIGSFAVLGGLAGASGGGAGALKGGAVGAAFGSAYFDTVHNAMDRIFREGENQIGAVDTARRAALEGIIDVSVAGLGAFAPYAARTLRAKLLGITSVGEEIARAGARLPGQTTYTRSIFNPRRYIDGKQIEYKGILPLPVQVSESGVIRGWPTVVGRIPFIGTPIKGAATKQMDQIKNFVNTLPGRISSQTLSDPDLAKSLGTKIKDFEERLKSLQSRQLKLNEVGEKLGGIIDMPDTTVIANRWLRSFAARHPDNRPSKATIKVFTEIRDAAKKGKLTLKEWNDLVGKAQRQLENVNFQGGKGADEIVDLLETARVDLMGTPKIGAKQIGMDRAWERFLTEHEIAVSKKLALIGPASKEYKGTIAKLASKNPDELVGLMMRSKNPQFIQGVRTVVGDDAVKDLAARYMDKVTRKSFIKNDAGVEVFNPDAFSKALGMNDKKGFEYAVTRELLKGTGVTEEMLSDFVKVATAASSIEIPNVAMFVARRAVLGGVKSGLAAFLGAGLSGAGGHGAAGTAGGIIAPLVLVMLARRGSKMLTNPSSLRLATTALDANANQVVRRSAAIRLFELYARDDQGLPSGETEEIQIPELSGFTRR